MGALAAVHLSADNALCILYGNPSFGIREEDDKRHHREHTDHDKEQGKDVKVSVLHGDNQAVNHCGTSGHDTREQDHGNTVAYALFVDILAQPHNQRGTSRKGPDDDDGCKHTAVKDSA